MLAEHLARYDERVEAEEFDELALLRAIEVTTRYRRLPPELAEELAAISERILTAEELQRRIDAPFAPGEREELEAYIAWFQRQYPTPLERLRWASRSYRQWTGNVPESRK